MDQTCSQKERRQECCQSCKPTGQRPLGKSRHKWKWEGNGRMDLEEIGINTRNWVESAQDRNCWRALVNAALNLRFHKLVHYLVYVLSFA